jgi:glutamate-1-semialdehyde 2,1-aminomutase
VKSSPAELSFKKSVSLSKRAHEIIPGGCHTYAKGDDQYPVLAPGFIARGQGCHVWDVDGNEFIEYGMGNRAVGLGHAYPQVVAAAQSGLALGSNFTRPCSVEVDCAQQFLELIQGTEMVKFCKDGSDATSGAVRLARAYTGRDYIARCQDHPFFSVDDWFIGTTAINAGIPDAISQLTLSFPYGDLPAAEALFREYPNQIAAFILEPARDQHPPRGYLAALKELCHKHGALLIFDEMITGFRWHKGGAQAYYDIEPDLSTFGKALSNGFSVSALAGKKEYMRLGGIHHTDRPRVFLLSTTHGAETHALTAAIATMRIYRDEPVIEHLWRQGERLRAGITQSATKHGLERHFTVRGLAPCLIYTALDADLKPSQAFRTLLLQETIKRGVLIPSLVVGYSHTDDDVDRTVDALDESFEIYSKALNDGVEKFLHGRPSQIVYRKYNTA